jgi:spore maturation protein CgeB
MRLVVFGLTVSSSWGNGHATIWRGLLTALSRQGHRAIFFERDVPYYASHRDLREAPEYGLVLYPDWAAVHDHARRVVADADATIVTSYCPDARAAAELVLEAGRGVRAFYDLDTPVTLERRDRAEDVEYVPPGGLGAFDVVLSYTGGPALDALRTRLGARRVAPLYGSADPAVHRPTRPEPRLQADLSYLGTYAPDRQPALRELFLEPARRCPGRRFLIGGALYPADFPWAPNVWFLRHVAPPEHPAFYCSSSLTLSVTRAAMARMGYCPSGRLFEAAACGTAIVSDPWDGLDAFFEVGREILVAESAGDVTAALDLSPEARRRVGAAARARVLAEHTADHRARRLAALLEGASTSGLAA